MPKRPHPLTRGGCGRAPLDPDEALDIAAVCFAWVVALIAAAVVWGWIT